MKALTVILVVILLLQLGTVGIGLTTGDVDHPSAQDIKDGRWDPKEHVRNLADRSQFFDRFRTPLELPWESRWFARDVTEEVRFGNGDEHGRLVKFKLESGTGVKIRYSPPDDEAQTICLCPKGATVVARDFVGCDGSGVEGSRCSADGDIGSIVVYSEKGKISFTGLGSNGGTVVQP